MNVSNKKAVNWLIFAHFIIDCYPGFIAPMLPFITAKIGVQMSAAMLIISVANISSYFMQPLFGYMADRWKKRFFIFWGIIIASLCIPLMGYANNFTALTIAIILGEIGVGFFHPQSTSFVPRFCRNAEQAKLDMGCFLSMGSIGYGVGALTATNIYDHFGSEALIYTSIVGILTALSMFIFIPKLSNLPEEQKQITPPLITCLKQIFSHKIVSTLVFASIVKSLIVSSYTMIMPFYWKSIGFSASKIGIISCIFLSTSTLGMITAPKIEKYIGTRNTFYLSFISILPIAIITYYLLRNNHVEIAIGFYAIIGYMIFLTQPLNVVMSQKLLPDYKCMISGVVGGFCWGVIGILLPLLSLFGEKIGILQALLIISCVPIIFCKWVKIIPKQPID